MNDMKMEFDFSKELIRMDGVFSYEQIMQMLEQMFAEEDLKPTGLGVFEGNYDNDYESFFRLMVKLMQKEWMRKYCNKWIFYNPEEGVGNVLLSMRNHNLCH